MSATGTVTLTPVGGNPWLTNVLAEISDLSSRNAEEAAAGDVGLNLVRKSRLCLLALNKRDT